MDLQLCKECSESLELDAATFRPLWDQAGEEPLGVEAARDAWELLFRISLGRVYRRGGARLARYFPTPKVRDGGLANKSALWWVFHATSGVDVWPMVVWFSGQPRKGRDGSVGLRGGSTHFGIEHDGTLWCFVPPDDSAWHCRRRNRDSLSVELVNATALRLRVEEGGEHYRWWSGRYALPYRPVRLAAPWRGAEHWQPYDERQLVALVKLVRMANEAMGEERFSRGRMSQHSDWNERKLDCGPLFPFDAVVEAVFSGRPVSELGWAQALMNPLDPMFDADTELSTAELEELFGHAVEQDAELGDADEQGDEDTEITMIAIQRSLADLGLYMGRIDGVFGPLTRAATKAFQKRWSMQCPQDPIKVDGIPGPQTCRRLFGRRAFP